jgi:sec-independent protein translocase protein TatA
VNFGAPEVLFLLLIVLLLFGASRLPKLARSFGQASKEFKEGVPGARRVRRRSSPRSSDRHRRKSPRNRIPSRSTLYGVSTTFIASRDLNTS